MHIRALHLILATVAIMVLVILSAAFIGEQPPAENDSDSLPAFAYEKREVQVTDGVRHTVPLSDIVGGGPPKDGIPSIDQPQFVTPQAADEWLQDSEMGIAIAVGETTRFYPYQILVWHEIVNDVVEGEEMLITYCPLCLSGIVFDPLVGGEHVDFGTSGKLWNSNLVMYDRATESYWSQALGEAIQGERAGDRLEVLPSDQITYGAWKLSLEAGTGEVLSRDTGEDRFYGDDPYGDYYTNNESILSPVANTDNRLESKEFVLGVVIDGNAKAYLPEAIKREGEVVDEFAGRTLVLRYNETLDAVRVFERSASGIEERITPLGQFWFSWVAIHPETELFK
jgi:hypothetical protein